MKTIKRLGNNNNITGFKHYLQKSLFGCLQVVFMQVPWNVPRLGLLQGYTQQYHIINITSLKECEKSKQTADINSS